MEQVQEPSASQNKVTIADGPAIDGPLRRTSILGAQVAKSYTGIGNGGRHSQQASEAAQ